MQVPIARFWLCPLYSFASYSENVALDEGIRIKSDLPGLRDYIRERSHGRYGRCDDPSTYNAVLLLPYRAEDKGVSDPAERMQIGFEENDRARDLLFGLVTALRLCHEGKITMGLLIFSSINHDSKWSIGGTMVWTPVSQRDSFHQDPKYVLQQADVPQVNKLVGNLAELRKLEKLEAINIALRRFNSAYHGYIEDRLIDQMIAFESLFLGDVQELTYKLALRVAFLLGKRKKTIFDDMKKAYKYRSGIVHGNMEVDCARLKEITPKSEEYLRQSIKKFLILLSKGMSLKQIRDKLDKNILTNGRTFK